MPKLSKTFKIFIGIIIVSIILLALVLAAGLNWLMSSNADFGAIVGIFLLASFFVQLVIAVAILLIILAVMVYTIQKFKK